MPTPTEINDAIIAIAKKYELMDANCAPFAFVLNKVLGGDGSYITADSGQYDDLVDHVALIFDDRIYDGDGFHSQQDFIDTWTAQGCDIFEEFFDISANGEYVRRLTDSASVVKNLDEGALEADLQAALELRLVPTP